MARTSNKIQYPDIPLSVVLDVSKGDMGHPVLPGHLFWTLQKAALAAAHQEGMRYTLEISACMFTPHYFLGEMFQVDGFRRRELTVSEVELVQDGKKRTIVLHEPFSEMLFS